MHHINKHVWRSVEKPFAVTLRNILHAGEAHFPTTHVEHQQPVHDSWTSMSCCFLCLWMHQQYSCQSWKAKREKSLETTSNSFKHFRPGWWFAFSSEEWLATSDPDCTSITLRTLVHSSMQRPAKSSAIRWGSREKIQPNTITSSKSKSQSSQIICNINKTHSIYIISCEELLGAPNQTGKKTIVIQL